MVYSLMHACELGNPQGLEGLSRVTGHDNHFGALSSEPSIMEIDNLVRGHGRERVVLC